MSSLPAYCFFKAFDPEPAKVLEFDRHYLLYSAKGAMRLSSEERDWVLPPSRAAWIPASTPLEVEISHPMICCSVLFHPDYFHSPTDECQVIALPPFVQEMIQHTRRWGPDETDLDTHAMTFFKALAGACGELLEEPSEVWLPRGKSEALRRALEYTQSNLAEQMSFADIASAARVSERSLARLFASETGMTWRELQRRMRMIKALELLSNADDLVANIALDVGYNSLSAFNRAFRTFSGYSPTDYRANNSSLGASWSDAS